MGFIIWLIVGGVVGWLASLVMRTDGQQGIILNIVVGIVGAVIAGLILGGGNINNSDPLDLTNILYSLLGAIILLAVVNLVRRGIRPLKSDAYSQSERPRGITARPFLCLLKFETEGDGHLELLLTGIDLGIGRGAALGAHHHNR